MQRERGKVPTNVNKDMVASGTQTKLSELRQILEERRKQGKPVLERPTVSNSSVENKIKQIIQAKQTNKDEHNR